MCLRIPMGVPQEDMSREVFDALVDNMAGVRELVFRGWGEPLMHKNFLEYIERIRHRAPQVHLRITTNGHLLKDDLMKQIIRLGLDRIMISIDRIKGGDSAGHPGPEKVTSNIEAFLRERDSLSRPELVLQPTMHRGGLNDILDVVRFARDVGADMVNLLRLDVWLPDGISRPDRREEMDIVRQAREASEGKVEVFFLNQRSLPLQIASHWDRLCLRTLFHVYIDVRGNVTPCCMLRDKVMGNILNRSIKEIWRSDRFDRFFEEQNQICSGCDAFFVHYSERTKQERRIGSPQ